MITIRTIWIKMTLIEDFRKEDDEMAVILLNKKEWTKDGRKWIFYTRYKDLSDKTKQYKSKKFPNKKESN